MSSQPHHASGNSSQTTETEVVHPAAQFPQPADREPFSASFWDIDTHTASIRKGYVVALAQGTLLTAVAILAILSIYWGALWKIEDAVHNLNGWVVDFDGGSMGQTVQAAAMDATGPRNKIAWTVVSASSFNNGPSDVIQAVLDEKCWVAVVINPDATKKLNSAVSTADASYNGSLAVSAFALEARNENSYPLLIVPMTQMVLNMASENFAEQHAKQLASNPNITTLLSTSPGIITRPMYYTMNNLRPFDVTAASAADFVGLIYLLIIAFLITNLNFTARMASGLTRHLTLGSLIQVRIFSAVIMYFFLSLIFSLLSLAFQIPFDRRFGHVGFLIFWMLSWVAMCALSVLDIHKFFDERLLTKHHANSCGLALEVMVTLLTPKFTPYFMILWIIVDVSVCYYPIEILPPIYRYGFAAPFYNVSRAVRTIIFSTRNQVGLNFGVEFAWIGVSIVTLPIFQWFSRRQEVRQWRAKRQSVKES